VDFQRSDVQQQAEWPRLSDVHFYLHGATIGYTALQNKLQNDSPLLKNIPTIERYFGRYNIILHRSIADDSVLAKAIAAELELRHVKPGDLDHVALISEWDTIYGPHVRAHYGSCFRSRLRR
jgi:hypothetical protein